MLDEKTGAWKNRQCQGWFLIAAEPVARLYFEFCVVSSKRADRPKQFQANPGLVPVALEDVGITYNKENTVNSRIILTSAALAAACLLGTAAAWAQAGPAAGTPTPKPVGIINLRAAIGSTAEGKQASAELQSQFAPRSAEIDNLTKQINDLQQRLQSGQGKLSQEEEARLTAEGQRLTQRLDRRRNDFQEDASAAQQDVLERIGRKMVDVLDRYARENGFSVILDVSGQNSPILYASDQIDVTQTIVRLYDQAYPVKAGSTPATPATSKPAAAPKPTTPTKPPQQ
jgi:outer membrane protein